ncbi:MAG TPA: hypothetical protein VJI66_01570 [Candidatus Paceibacterota bacterium]
MTSTEQSHQIMAAFAINTDWTKVRFDAARLQDRIIRDPVGASKQFLAFLNNGAELVIGEPKIITVDRSQPFNPATFKGLGNGWTIWKGPIDGDGLKGEEEQDSRSLALTELDLTRVRFETSLKSGESQIKGEVKFARLKEAGHVRLDAKVFQTFWENQRLIPLQWKEKTNGNTTHIFFNGTVLRDPFGHRSVLYLCWFGGRWCWDYHWLDSGWAASNPSAVLESQP